MKVLLTATVQSHICQFHRPLADVLHQHGCEVHVAAKDNLAEKNGLKLDFADKIFNVPFARSPLSLDNFRAYRILKKIIDEGDYDIIHCNTPMGGIVTRLAARAARKRGTKVFYTAHGFHFYQGAPLKNWLIYYPIEKFFARFTDKLITMNSEDLMVVAKYFSCSVGFIHGVGVDPERYFPIADTEKMASRKTIGLSDTQKVLLCVGELIPRKNEIMAIRSMKYIVDVYPDAVLFIAGNGPLKNVLQTEIHKLQIENNVKMLGYCTRLQDYQRVADVAISCSYQEGLPLNIVEAMLSGTPVVATKNRGHNELIQDGKNGFLVEQNDAKSMALSVLQLLSGHQLRGQVIAAAEKKAASYTFANVKQELKRIYFSKA